MQVPNPTQPRSLVYKLFDQVYLMSQGNAVFFGKRESLGATNQQAMPARPLTALESLDSVYQPRQILQIFYVQYRV